MNTKKERQGGSQWKTEGNEGEEEGVLAFNHHQVHGSFQKVRHRLSMKRDDVPVFHSFPPLLFFLQQHWLLSVCLCLNSLNQWTFSCSFLSLYLLYYLPFRINRRRSGIMNLKVLFLYFLLLLLREKSLSSSAPSFFSLPLTLEKAEKERKKEHFKRLAKKRGRIQEPEREKRQQQQSAAWVATVTDNMLIQLFYAFPSLWFSFFFSPFFSHTTHILHTGIRRRCRSRLHPKLRCQRSWSTEWMERKRTLYELETS